MTVSIKHCHQVKVCLLKVFHVESIGWKYVSIQFSCYVSYAAVTLQFSSQHLTKAQLLWSDMNILLVDNELMVPKLMLLTQSVN